MKALSLDPQASTKSKGGPINKLPPSKQDQDEEFRLNMEFLLQTYDQYLRPSELHKETKIDCLLLLLPLPPLPPPPPPTVVVDDNRKKFYLTLTEEEVKKMIYKVNLSSPGPALGIGGSSRRLGPPIFFGLYIYINFMGLIIFNIDYSYKAFLGPAVVVLLGKNAIKPLLK